MYNPVRSKYVTTTQTTLRRASSTPKYSSEENICPVDSQFQQPDFIQLSINILNQPLIQFLTC
jgi:hypothetical protein